MHLKDFGKDLGIKQEFNGNPSGEYDDCCCCTGHICSEKCLALSSLVIIIIILILLGIIFPSFGKFLLAIFEIFSN